MPGRWREKRRRGLDPLRRRRLEPWPHPRPREEAATPMRIIVAVIVPVIVSVIVPVIVP
jgi:hypothetical protein